MSELPKSKARRHLLHCGLMILLLAGLWGFALVMWSLGEEPPRRFLTVAAVLTGMGAMGAALSLWAARAAARSRRALDDAQRLLDRGDRAEAVRTYKAFLTRGPEEHVRYVLERLREIYDGTGCQAGLQAIAKLSRLYDEVRDMTAQARRAKAPSFRRLREVSDEIRKTMQELPEA